jgi:ribonuclease HII
MLPQDSKAMTEAERKAVYEVLVSHKEVLHAVHIVEHSRIDEINILQATLEAMRESVKAVVGAMDKEGVYVFVDGNQ